MANIPNDPISYQLHKRIKSPAEIAISYLRREIVPIIKGDKKLEMQIHIDNIERIVRDLKLPNKD